jgi:hypothetical protein
LFKSFINPSHDRFPSVCNLERKDSLVNHKRAASNYPANFLALNLNLHHYPPVPSKRNRDPALPFAAFAAAPPARSDGTSGFNRGCDRPSSMRLLQGFKVTRVECGSLLPLSGLEACFQRLAAPASRLGQSGSKLPHSINGSHQGYRVFLHFENFDAPLAASGLRLSFGAL